MTSYQVKVNGIPQSPFSPADRLDALREAMAFEQLFPKAAVVVTESDFSLPYDRCVKTIWRSATLTGRPVDMVTELDSAGRIVRQYERVDDGSLA